MRASFGLFLPLLVLSQLSVAVLTASLDRRLNSTLVRRVRIPNSPLPNVQTVQTIFSIGIPGDPGVCTAGQLAIINNWLIDVLELHDAAVNAYVQVQDGDLGSAMLFQFLMGIRWNGEFPTDATEDLFDQIANRLNAVSRFLAGGGLEEAKTSESPYIFCEDSFATYANPQQPMLDSRGNSIPVKDKDGNVVGYKTIEELFPFWDFSASTPFWVGHFQAYLFDSNGFPTLCGRPTLQAATNVPPHHSGHPPIPATFYTKKCDF